jgi:hypothetical protein
MKENIESMRRYSFRQLWGSADLLTALEMTNLASRVAQSYEYMSKITQSIYMVAQFRRESITKLLAIVV